MKKIFLTGTLALAASLGGLTVSCGDFLDITPLNAVVVQNYWEKKSEVESVITSCYYHMQDAGFAQRVIAWGEVRGDNLTSSSTMEADNKEMYDFYINNITADNSWTSWADFYNVINLCNTMSELDFSDSLCTELDNSEFDKERKEKCVKNVTLMKIE